MGLPISDTAMAIFRRWVRNLPLSAADRRHVHHLLMGLGLNPREAAVMLYFFASFLCGAVMLGVAWGNEYLTLILGIFGCLAFLLVVTSRRDELSNLRDDLQDRLARGRQERTAAKLTWEAIQRIELCPTAEAAGQVLDRTARDMGCRRVRIAGLWLGEAEDRRRLALESVSGPSAIFRLSGGRGRWITMELALGTETPLAADIVFRYMQRLGQALAGRIERLEEAAEPDPAESPRRPETPTPAPPEPEPAPAPRGIGRIGAILGRLAPTGRRPAADRLTRPHSPARP
jgi:UDP-GlcNAc:undecaprenyl-phosphate GlcNAc-1-phosphate transferase